MLMQPKNCRKETARVSAGNGRKLSGNWLSRLLGVHSKGSGYRKWLLISRYYTKL